VKRSTLAVFFEYASRAAAGLVLAAPFTAAVAATGIGAFPEGDRLLFEPGGLLLVEAARASWTLFAPLVTSSLVTLALASVALSLPQALLWTAVAEDTPSPFPVWLGRAGTRLPSFLALVGLGFLGQVLVCTLGLAATGFLRRTVPDPIHADLWALGSVAVAGLVALTLGVLRDVSSAAVACGAPDARAGLRAAVEVVFRGPGAAFARWVKPAVLALTLVVVAAAAVGVLDVSRPGALRLTVVFAVHQAVLLALGFCRAAWFAAAVRFVRPQVEAASMARR
jgi:hypothetical protein